MDNRRPPNGAPNPYNRNKNFRKEGEKPVGYGNYQSRDRNFQPRNDRLQKPEGGFPPRDGKFVKREGKFPPKNDKFQPRRGFAAKGKPTQPWKKEEEIRIVSDLQVTDGKHRGKYLTTSVSPKYRLTSRRIRETTFKILFRKVRARRFLDLGAGCGMVGIEAISRGALVATMVERSARLCTLIKKNLESCTIKTGHGEVVEMEVVPFLKMMWKRRRFWDVVYLDTSMVGEASEELKFLARGATVAPGGVIVLEHHSDRSFPDKIGVLRRFRVVVQGDISLSFYERK